jgi:hypothetical protein
MMRAFAPHLLLLPCGLAALVTACDEGGATVPNVCGPATCATAPLPTCEGNVRVAWQAIGTCTVTPAGEASCAYPELQRQDCATVAGGARVCQAGQCVTPTPVPCADLVCNDPPPPDCDGTVSRIYATNGTCDPSVLPNGQCVYAVEATLDCATLGRPCNNGSCADPSATPCEPNPCDVPPPGQCARRAPQRYADVGACTSQGSGFDNYTCDYGLNQYTECSGATPACAGGLCARAIRAPAAAGELVFNELLVNPSDAGDLGEWFELYNPTPDALDLADCLLSDDGTNRYTFPGEGRAVVPALGYFVVGRSGDRDESGGFVPDIAYDNVQLGNGEDALALICGGVLIDRVAWDSATWPMVTAASLALKAGAANATANDQPTSWCSAAAAYGNRQNKGTPRKANACP